MNCEHKWRDYTAVDPQLTDVDECVRCGVLARRPHLPETPRCKDKREHETTGVFSQVQYLHETARLLVKDGVTMRRAAAICGVSPSTISRIVKTEKKKGPQSWLSRKW